jgi:hypothetical protein
MPFRMTIAPIRARLRQLARSERGMALPVALFAMIASMALAGAAVVSSVNVQHGSKHDSGAKSSIAVADGGANVATMRLARYATALSAEQPCLGQSGGVLVATKAEANGWCPAVTGTLGEGTYTYRASPIGTPCGTYDLCLVATGTVDGVSRRIEMTFNESTLYSSDEDETEEEGGGSSGGSFEGLVGQEGIELSGNADIRVGIGTDGNVISSGNASVCGDIRHGIGKKWTKSGNASQCNGYNVTEANMTLPSVSSFMPSDIATHNSNGRITQCASTNNPVDCQKDGFTGKWSSSDPFSPTSRQISLSSNDTLTVGGGDYWVCSLSMSGNSQLIMAAGATVRFFFDTPENCGLSSGANQINLSGNNRIAATGYQPNAGDFDVPGFYLLGSTSKATGVNLSGNHSTTNEFVIYGPNTQINISGNATFKGLIAGKKIVMSGNGRFENDSGFTLPPELQPPSQSEEEGTETLTERHFTPQTYVECTGTALSVPNENC